MSFTFPPYGWTIFGKVIRLEIYSPANKKGP